MKLLWQMQMGQPDLADIMASGSDQIMQSAGKMQGWKDCIKFYQQAAIEPATAHDEQND